MITHEDIQEIKKVLDDRYVMQSDCDETQRKMNSKLSNDDKRIETLYVRLNLWNKLLWTIASASVSALVVSILELVLK